MEYTPRQREILPLIASGLTDKEIARRLGISVATVKAHLRRLYKRLGVRNRAEAVAKWKAETND